MKFATYTLGCKVAQYESEAVAEALIGYGLSEVDFSEHADIYIINTCTVTAESDAKCRKYIRRAIRQNPSATVAVMGCYSQRSARDVAAIDGVSLVLGTADKMLIAPLSYRLAAERSGDALEIGRFNSTVLLPLEFKMGFGIGADENTKKCYELFTKHIDLPLVLTKELDGAEFEEMCITRPQRTRAYVKIEDGCECRCTYCAIAAARGPVRSKRPEDVIREVEGLSRGGTREIVLTGIETGSYGADFKENYGLGDLIAELDERESCQRIRLGSLAPELIGQRFIEKVKGTKILAPHFHLSMQSGSDKVLRRMKRRYTVDMALKNMEIIRSAFPGATFTTDLMVGFPGESEEDFAATMELVSAARFLDCHVFAYSQRPGTPAAEYAEQVPEEIKRQRSERLIAHKNSVRDSVLEEICKRGEPISCIFEAKNGRAWTAHSDTFIEVRVESDEELSGEMYDVIPQYAKGGIIYGKVL